MTEITHAPIAHGADDRSAVGRLIILVEVAGGTEKVTYERRLTDAPTARSWCEDKLRSAPEASAVLEIQVTEEIWGHRHAWDATASRYIPETLQLGRRALGGSITWGVPYGLGRDHRARQL